MDDKADETGNHFYDLPATMKRRNHHVVLLGNGVHIIVNLARIAQAGWLARLQVDH